MLVADGKMGAATSGSLLPDSPVTSLGLGNAHSMLIRLAPTMAVEFNNMTDTRLSDTNAPEIRATDRGNTRLSATESLGVTSLGSNRISMAHAISLIQDCVNQDYHAWTLAVIVMILVCTSRQD